MVEAEAEVGLFKSQEAKARFIKSQEVEASFQVSKSRLHEAEAGFGFLPISQLPATVGRHSVDSGHGGVFTRHFSAVGRLLKKNKKIKVDSIFFLFEKV